MTPLITREEIERAVTGLTEMEVEALMNGEAFETLPCPSVELTPHAPVPAPVVTFKAPHGHGAIAA